MSEKKRRGIRSCIVERILGIKSLRSITDYETDYTLVKRPCFPGEPTLSTGERFGVQLFASIKGTIHMVRETFAVHLFI